MEGKEKIEMKCISKRRKERWGKTRERGDGAKDKRVRAQPNKKGKSPFYGKLFKCYDSGN